MSKNSKSSKPLISIITLNHNHAELTLRCVHAIKKHTTHQKYEIVIVDNGSLLTERAILKPGLNKIAKIKIKLIQSKRNIGFGAGCNLASKNAKGEFLVFLNNDIFVTKNWLKPLINFLIKNPLVGACQPKIKSFYQKKFFDYAGGAGGFLDIFGYPFTMGRVFNSIEKDLGQYNKTHEITWASGACFVIVADIFKKAGGFDEYFFAYHEEIDLCLRLNKKGYKIYSIPSSTVYHHGGFTSHKNLYFKTFLNHHNSLYLLLKHYSLFPFVLIFLTRFMLDIFSCAYYLLELRFSFILAVLKAYVKIFYNLPTLFKNGTITLTGKSLLDNTTLIKRSIVFDYFLLRRINFDMIQKTNHKLNREYKCYQEVTSLSNPKSFR